MKSKNISFFPEEVVIRLVNKDGLQNWDMGRKRESKQHKDVKLTEHDSK